MLIVDGKEAARQSMEHTIPVTFLEDEPSHWQRSSAVLLWPAVFLHAILTVLLTRPATSEQEKKT